MEFTHLNEKGEAHQVNVSQKPVIKRMAKAKGTIFLLPQTIEKIISNQIQKGSVLLAARIAAIQAAKKTSDLIPLCHPLCLDHIEVDFEIEKEKISVISKTEIHAKTGVEMEALTAVTIGLLTIYDMCKAVDKNMKIGEITLLEKMKGAKC